LTVGGLPLPVCTHSRQSRIRRPAGGIYVSAFLWYNRPGNGGAVVPFQAAARVSNIGGLSPAMEVCMIEIRKMRVGDLPRLSEIDPGFVSDSVLDVRKMGAGLDTGWQLTERRLAEPFDKGRRYDLKESDQAEIRQRMAQGSSLHLIAIDQGGSVAGMLDLALETWNNTAFLWFLLVDRAYRGQGLGRRLFNLAIDHARRLELRALVIETQSNNAPACRFYAAMGCELVGLNDILYSNEDIELGEVALFWAYRLDAGVASTSGA
jgi:ribosomal protein S18 acetylase RimI-like enzyme